MTAFMLVLFILLALPLTIKGLVDLHPPRRATVPLRVVVRNDFPRRPRAKRH